MGSLSRPDPEREKRINELLDDLSPEVRELAKKLLSENKGEDLDKKLRDLIGIKKTREFINRRR